MAIFDQGCQLMVRALPPFRARINEMNFLDRMQVRMFSALDDKCLT
jgi:hypothetical protein